MVRPTLNEATQYNAQLDKSIVRDPLAFADKVGRGWPAYKLALERGLLPTPYFFEALHYISKARKLQTASLAGKRVPKVGDPLMEAIPIYNTVQRRYAGFSNVPELLWYGTTAPKSWQHDRLPYKVKRWCGLDMFSPSELEAWLFVLLAHRLTGSGASFEHDHGFRNNRIIEMQRGGGLVTTMADWLAKYDGPIFTSIGNQIPPFPKCGGREYLRTLAPELCGMVAGALMCRQAPMPIKTAVDMFLRFQKAQGTKQFKFVITAWVMDMAEYLPHLVDPTSDCYHGKNAIEAIEACFTRVPGMRRQEWYDAATRLFADVSGTHPMDVEDASPGCDFVRWLENYVPKKGFDHVREQGLHNGSSLVWHAGRQS